MTRYIWYVSRKYKDNTFVILGMFSSEKRAREYIKMYKEKEDKRLLDIVEICLDFKPLNKPFVRGNW